jgi:predicted SAM-dependent methyltransferase
VSPFTIDPIEQAKSARRLNVGAGRHPLPYWTNCDADPNIPADLHFTAPPLPFADGSLDDIYAGHFIEHLTPEDARLFLAECFRCLSPGGRLGIVVPDTREIMRRYLAGAPDEMEYPQGEWSKVADLDAVCRLFLYSTAQDSPHKWSFDADSLRRVMTEADFVNFTPIDRYHDPRLGTGQWYQVGWNAMKSVGA